MKHLPKLLSKTRLMRGYQCLKSIYLTIHHKELEPPVTPDLQAIFDQGNVVGAEARKKYPNGVLVDFPAWDFFGSLKKTRELLKQETEVIYEAAFEYKGCYARADIIVYSKESKRWSVYEVKSTTKVKDEHLDDVGLQAWIMVNAGLPIEKIHILHLNTDCRYPDLSNLFKEVDVTEELRARHSNIPKRLTSIFDSIRNQNPPDVDIGPHCSSPNDCPFISHCWSERKIPEYGVFNLPGIKSKKWDFYKDGIVSLDDPRLTDISENQKIVVQCFKDNIRYINKIGIQSELSKWKFPLVFLDFETINPAIPRYEKTKPYQQVPFQFSAHIWPNPDTAIIHKEYLHTDKSDPRDELIPKLLEACGKTGSIVSYYAQFESARISEMADYSKIHTNELLALLDRIVDPLPLIRENVYDNAFKGSFSLKDVAPAILGDNASYAGMSVDNGTAAQRAFEEIINESTPSDRRKELIQASLDYCRKDTIVMVDLVKWLYSTSADQK